MIKWSWDDRMIVRWSNVCEMIECSWDDRMIKSWLSVHEVFEWSCVHDVIDWSCVQGMIVYVWFRISSFLMIGPEPSSRSPLVSRNWFGIWVRELYKMMAWENYTIWWPEVCYITFVLTCRSAALVYFIVPCKPSASVSLVDLIIVPHLWVVLPQGSPSNRNSMLHFTFI